VRDIDQIIAELSQEHPEIAVRQLEVTHPGVDDDGIWFFTYPGRLEEVQLESSSGALPFLIESNYASVYSARTVKDAVVQVANRLGLP